MTFPLQAVAFALLLGAEEAPPAVPAHPLDEGPGALITNADYPAAALRNEEQGDVTVRLDIDASGRVSGCTTVGSSGSPALDAATCSLMRERARYSPALDAEGRPVPDTHQRTVGWRIAPASAADAVNAAAVQEYILCLAKAARPLATGTATVDEIVEQAFAACDDAEAQTRTILSDSASPPATAPSSAELRRIARPVLLQIIERVRSAPQVRARPVGGASLARLVSAADYPAAARRAGQQGSVRVRIEVDEAGRPGACAVIESSGFESLDSATCRLLRERAMFTPARDGQGRAVADSFIQRITWQLRR